VAHDIAVEVSPEHGQNRLTRLWLASTRLSF
jgi:hypothetical protein